MRGMEHINFLNWMGFGILGGFLIRAMYTDWKEGKIENRMIVCGYGTALLFAFADGGFAGCIESIKGACIMIIALYFLFILKGLGAGDIKLLSVISAFYPKHGFSIVIHSFIIAGIFIICRMIYRRIRNKPVYIKNETLHFSIPIAISTLVEFLGIIIIPFGWR